MSFDYFTPEELADAQSLIDGLTPEELDAERIEDVLAANGAWPSIVARRWDELSQLSDDFDDYAPKLVKIAEEEGYDFPLLRRLLDDDNNGSPAPANVHDSYRVHHGFKPEGDGSVVDGPSSAGYVRVELALMEEQLRGILHEAPELAVRGNPLMTANWGSDLSIHSADLSRVGIPSGEVWIRPSLSDDHRQLFLNVVLGTGGRPRNDCTITVARRRQGVTEAAPPVTVDRYEHSATVSIPLELPGPQLDGWVLWIDARA